MISTKIRKEGDTLYLFVYHNNKKMKISTGVKVEDSNWNGQNILKKDPLHQVKNTKLSEVWHYLMKAQTNLGASGLPFNLKRLKREYLRVTGEMNGESDIEEKNFWEEFTRFLGYKEKTVRKTTYNSYVQLKRNLEFFEKRTGIPFEPDNFDKDLFVQLIEHMVHVLDYKDSSVDKHLRYLRTFLKWAYPEYDRSFISYKSRLPENIEPLFKSEVALLQLHNAKSHLQKVKDLFLFCCYTGMRFSDSQKFHPSWISENVITYIQQKSDVRAMVPYTTKVKEIISRYRNHTPGISNAKYNYYLKHLFRDAGISREVRVISYLGNQKEEKIVPFYEQVTSHTARKTFITLALASGIPVQDVMKMSGHSDFKSMKAYIRISKEHIGNMGSRIDW